jgi:hypothetical protein
MAPTATTASGEICGLIFARILLWTGGSISIFMPPVAVPGKYQRRSESKQPQSGLAI